MCRKTRRAMIFTDPVKAADHRKRQAEKAAAKVVPVIDVTLALHRTLGVETVATVYRSRHREVGYKAMLPSHKLHQLARSGLRVSGALGLDPIVAITANLRAILGLVSVYGAAYG